MKKSQGRASRNKAITKAFGKRGSLHKKLGIPSNQKIGAARLKAQGGKVAKLALKLDY